MSKGVAVMAVGVGLIVTGVLLTIYQMRSGDYEMMSDDIRPFRITMTTKMPGLVIIAIGAVMLIAGAVIPV